ncbi:MAG: M48 family metalloprotease [Oligoflexia bacterium]|nr:M48 family metalloprotease [Oligoflexia bacterium]
MDVQNSLDGVKGLAALTAIPVVAIALWNDYFARNLAELRKETPDFDKNTEALKVKLVSLFGLFFQLVIYLSAEEARAGYPLASNLLFFTAILAQWRLQLSAEAKISPPRTISSQELRPPRPGEPATTGNATLVAREEFRAALRAFGWSLFSGALYVGILIFSLRASFFLSQALKATPGWSLGILAVGAALGVLGGLGLGFGLGPLQLRKIFAARPLADEQARTEFETCFTQAGLAPPRIWVIELQQSQAGNALITGFPRGRGLFQPGLFLTQATLNGLERRELRAILLHEISHLKLQHLRKRFILSAGMILASSVGAGFLVVVTHLSFPDGSWNFLVGAGTVLLSLSYTFQLLARQSRYQEIEADINAVKLGAGIEYLHSALRKLDKINGSLRRAPEGQPAPLQNGSHPATDERVAILRKYFELHPEQLPEGARASPQEDAEDSQKRAA